MAQSVKKGHNLSKKDTICQKITPSLKKKFFFLDF